MSDPIYISYKQISIIQLKIFCVSEFVRNEKNKKKTVVVH